MDCLPIPQQFRFQVDETRVIAELCFRIAVCVIILVSTTCVGSWAKGNFNKNKRAFDPSACTDGGDSAAHVTLEGKVWQQWKSHIEDG